MLRKNLILRKIHNFSQNFGEKDRCLEKDSRDFSQCRIMKGYEIRDLSPHMLFFHLLQLQSNITQNG